MSEPTQSEGASPPGASATAVAAAPPPPKPAAPPKPPAKAPDKPTRRNFLVGSGLGFLGVFFGSWMAAAWTTFTLSMVGLLLGTVRFMFPNVLSEPPSSFKAGEVTGYEEGKVEDRFKEIGAWV